jgi:hypothetical protein
MKPWFILMASLLLPRVQAGPGLELSETYKDAPTGLTIHYPAGWRMDTQLFQGSNIIDFPPSRRPPQVFVPMNRADIGLFSPPEGEKTIAEWMRQERIDESRGHHISEITIATKSLGTLNVTAARSQPSVIPDGTSLLYFFEVEGRPIKATLSYRGRKRAAEFEDIFRSIIQNLEPLPAQKGR